jgi:adenosylhomocysteine nucleosidase
MAHIGIIVALDDEAAGIAKALGSVRIEEAGGNTFTSGSFADHTLTLVQSGMGTVNAAAATQTLIDRFGAEVVLFSGIAGNLNPDLAIGDVVVGAKLHYLDTDAAMIAESAPFLQEYASDPGLVELARETLDGIEDGAAQVKVGVIASGNYFVNAPEQVQRVRATVPEVDCVDMESAAVSHIAAKNGVKSLIIRAMSDNCDQDYEEFSDDFINIQQHAAVAARYVLEIVSAI